LPGVGLNLQDHVAAYGLTWLLDKPGVGYNPLTYTADISTYWNWISKRTGGL
jgi:hypothetical protein